MCLAGASTTATFPGALIRGGDFYMGAYAGPLAIGNDFGTPLWAGDPTVGFRCAR